MCKVQNRVNVECGLVRCNDKQRHTLRNTYLPASKMEERASISGQALGRKDYLDKLDKHLVCDRMLMEGPPAHMHTHSHT